MSPSAAWVPRLTDLRTPRFAPRGQFFAGKEFKTHHGVCYKVFDLFAIFRGSENLPLEYDFADMRRLAPAECKPYLSPYMVDGFRHERSELEEVFVDESRVLGFVSVPVPADSADDRFHFNSLTAWIWLTHLVHIHVGWSEGLSHKIGESYLREFNLICRRPVLRQERIPIEVRCPERKYRGNYLVYLDAEFAVDNGAFFGTITPYVFVPGTINGSREECDLYGGIR